MNLVQWSPRALEDYENNISYLLLEWSEKEADAFTQKATQIIKNISITPDMYPVLEGADTLVRKAVIVKQISLIYTHENNKVLLLNFWNSYQDPDLLKQLLEIG